MALENGGDREGKVVMGLSLRRMRDDAVKRKEEEEKENSVEEIVKLKGCCAA